MLFTSVYYEPDILNFPLGQKLQQDFADLPWHPIESHNRIPELSSKENADFPQLKRCLIIGTRKAHKYVPNQKISDYLVPFTSSGCTAMCLYCYLVCNYNKCSYLRLFVNREQMLTKLLKESHKTTAPATFEVGSNSDLILENTITNNLPWLIPAFAKNGRGFITFPTKFHMVEPLLNLEHGGKTIFRMSVNPQTIISRIELGTSSLMQRLQAVNQMHDAGYPIGILIAPVILLDNWQELYSDLIDTLANSLTESVKKNMTIEIIMMTYSYVHRAINEAAFPNAIPLFDTKLMTGRGRGKYSYRTEVRPTVEDFFRQNLAAKLPDAKLIYIC